MNNVNETKKNSFDMDKVKRGLFLSWELVEDVKVILADKGPLTFEDVKNVLKDNNVYFKALNNFDVGIDEGNLDKVVEVTILSALLDYVKTSGITYKEWEPVQDRTSKSLEATAKKITVLGLALKSTLTRIIESIYVELNKFSPGNDYLFLLKDRVIELMDTVTSEQLINEIMEHGHTYSTIHRYMALYVDSKELSKLDYRVHAYCYNPHETFLEFVNNLNTHKGILESNPNDVNLSPYDKLMYGKRRPYIPLAGRMY